jgi:hypothetical protein
VRETAEVPTSEQPITRAVRLDARFDRVRPADRVEIREIRILAGHAGGLHVHNGPVVGSVVAGSVRDVDGRFSCEGAAVALRPGCGPDHRRVPAAPVAGERTVMTA